uniref:E1B protein, small T-antigen n=1 Tax=Bat mastadenovirus TaxID=740971 RepID=A0A8G0RCZ3_9ADEN|nr:E1B [Bat mastadenovirus]
MDYLKFLCNYPVLKRIIRDASERTGPWRRYFFCGPLVNFVHKIKEEHKDDFAQCLDSDGHFLEQLRSGDLRLYSDQVVHYLYLENPGRVSISLAFVAWLLDQWDLDNQFSPEFALEALCIPLWKLIKAEVQKRDLGTAAQVFREEMEREGLLDPPASLAPETPPQREDTEEGGLHLAEPAVVEESEEESLGEEEMEEVETEVDSELEVVFASDNEVLSPRLDVASGLSSSSEEVACITPLSGTAPLASSDSSCSDLEEEEREEPQRGEPAHRVSVIVRAPGRGTEGESTQK